MFTHFEYGIIAVKVKLPIRISLFLSEKRDIYWEQYSPSSQCLKIGQKVALNIASEVSYVFHFEWTKVH